MTSSKTLSLAEGPLRHAQFEWLKQLFETRGKCAKVTPRANPQGATP